MSSPDLEQTADFQEGEPTPEPVAPAEGPKATVLGGYRLLRKLGEGGMGAVYQAEHVETGKPAAVKVMSQSLTNNPAFLHRFRREQEVMAKLDHPNVLRWYAAGESDGTQYLVMELVDGGTLHSWRKKLGSFSVGDALHVVIRTAYGLMHAHNHQLVHRDVKPDNVLLTRDGEIKVADLGLAKAVHDEVSVTRTGTGAGTPLYMGPEQFRDAKNVDHRTDIYALGCMLYVFLTGQQPFAGETYVEMFKAKMKGTFTPAGKLNPAVPPQLDRILDKMMAATPELRYGSCAELIEDLEGLGLAHDRLHFLDPPRDDADGEAAAPPDGDLWYVAVRNRQGQKVARPLRAGQIDALLRKGKLNARVPASRDPRSGYLPLGQIEAFREACGPAEPPPPAVTEESGASAPTPAGRPRWLWIALPTAVVLVVAVAATVLLLSGR